MIWPAWTSLTSFSSVFPIHFYALGSWAFFVFIEHAVCILVRRPLDLLLPSVFDALLWLLTFYQTLVSAHSLRLQTGLPWPALWSSLSLTLWCDLIFFLSQSRYWLWQASLSPRLNVSSLKTCAFSIVSCSLLVSQTTHQALRKYCFHKSLSSVHSLKVLFSSVRWYYVNLIHRRI